MDDPTSLGETAREPRTAAGVVATLAFLFNVVWVAGIAPNYLHIFLGGIQALAVVIVGTVNAYVVTWVLWRRYVTRPDTLSRRRGAGVGLVLSVVSMVTFTVAIYLLWGAASLLETGRTPPGFRSDGVIEYVLWTPITGAIGVFLGFIGTFGIQILICVGSGILLADMERRSHPVE